jgi:dsRNA-specific ribonuclease
MDDPVAALAARLPHHFNRPELLLHALTHRSAADPRKQMLDSNERLEFVGDRVLALLMAEWLAERFPAEREGDLGKRLAVLVAQDALAKVAAALGIAPALRVPATEERSGVRGRASVLADAVEAILGAIYLDGGLGPAGHNEERTFMHGKVRVTIRPYAWDEGHSLGYAKAKAEAKAEIERLHQIIREMQRHRFGRRAETRPRKTTTRQGPKKAQN